MTASSGKEECPCANTTDILASIPNRSCQLENGNPGVLLTIGGTCSPTHYGSSHCLQHDLIHDPRCSIDDAGESVIPSYCFRPWCYVDSAKCKGADSTERMYRSSYFEKSSGVDVYYSYSTCNSTAEDWFAVEDSIVGSRALGGVDIVGNVPTYTVPMMYKKDDNGEVLFSSGPEYYDDNDPWEGVYIKYVNDIARISEGDIASLNITHRTRASKIVHPTSSYTAAVQDLNDGLVDMAVGPFWVTGQRLKMTAFTLPIVYDKTYLVIPKPGTINTLGQQTKKVLMPFSNQLWCLSLGIILVAALLSVWFTDHSEEKRRAAARRNDRRMAMQPKTKTPKLIYLRLAMDSFIEKGLFFCSAGVEQDRGSSLPNKILLFGFGFFILISVSAYVANLAAFLTLKSTEEVRTMEAAVSAGYTICAHPAVKTELEVAWPEAKFYFHQDANEFPGVLDDYLAGGNCQVMAIGYEDTAMDITFLDRLCKENLVYTDSMVVEIPIAFPIRSDLTSGFSYWMYQGERLGVTLENSKNAFPQSATCDPHYKGEDIEGSEYDQIEIKNMFFPILFFTSCAVLGIILQLIHMRNVKLGKKDALGRKSTLNLVQESRRKDNKGTRSFSAETKRSSILQKLSNNYGQEEKDDLFDENKAVNGEAEEKEEEKEDDEETSLRSRFRFGDTQKAGETQTVSLILNDDVPQDEGTRTVRLSPNGGA